MQQDRSARDRALIEAARAGDQGSFAELVTAYQRLVAGVAWRYGIARDDVDDVVSEVFFKVYRKLDRYRPDHPFATWLYRLAANHVLDTIRKRKKESGRSEMPEQVVDPADGPETRAEGSERAALVRRGLQQVSERYRESLFLVYIEGLKVDETARVLGVPSGTIKTRLMRGRAQLRTILEHDHPGLFGEVAP